MKDRNSLENYKMNSHNEFVADKLTYLSDKISILNDKLENLIDNFPFTAPLNNLEMLKEIKIELEKLV